MADQVPHFVEQLDVLQQRLIEMGALAESRLQLALHGLLARDPLAIGQVLDGDEAINRLHVEVDNRALVLLALHQPMAGDLRGVVAAVKMSSDLERVGDLAVNIAEAASRLVDVAALPSWFDVPRMGAIAARMLHDASTAFERRDTALAQQVLESDDELDGIRAGMFHTIVETMRREPAGVAPLLELLLVARHLERVGDHATNIAEDVIFIVAARDVRYGDIALAQPARD